MLPLPTFSEHVRCTTHWCSFVRLWYVASLHFQNLSVHYQCTLMLEWIVLSSTTPVVDQLLCNLVKC